MRRGSLTVTWVESAWKRSLRPVASVAPVMVRWSASSRTVSVTVVSVTSVVTLPVMASRAQSTLSSMRWLTRSNRGGRSGHWTGGV